MKIDGRALSHDAAEMVRRLAAMRRGGERMRRARNHPGAGSKPVPKLKLQVRRRINGRDPRPHGFDFELWT
ncbi:MAG: hypothetical protein ACYDDO_10890 [Acidiferrobacterales bacterium]